MGEIISEYGKVILGVVAVIALCGILYFVGTKINSGVSTQVTKMNTQTDIAIPTITP